MENLKIQETIADIAYLAGQYGYYSGNSRQDMSDFIHIAEQFEKEFSHVDWEDTELDYIVEVEKFAMKKFNLSYAPFDGKLSLASFSLNDKQLRDLDKVVDIEVRGIFIDMENNNVEWTQDTGRNNAYGVYFRYSDRAIDRKETVPSQWVADFEKEDAANSFAALLKSFIILVSVNKQPS